MKCLRVTLQTFPSMKPVVAVRAGGGNPEPSLPLEAPRANGSY